MRYELKMHKESLASPYIGDVLGEHGYWHQDNGVHYARATHPQCQDMHDKIDWLADAKNRAKKEIVKRSIDALKLTPVEEMRRKAIAAKKPYIPTAFGYITMTNEAMDAEIAAIEAKEDAHHANCADFSAKIEASTKMADLVSARSNFVKSLN